MQQSSGFLYFLPGCRPGDVGYGVLERYGISHIVDSPSGKLHNRGCIGPNGVHGVVVGAADRWAAEDVKSSDLVEWVRFPKTFGQGEEIPLLGFRKDCQLPKPAALARTVKIPGEHLTLADNEPWLIPIARDYDGACKLPRAYDLDDETGEWVSTKVRREYAKIWAHAIGYYTAMQTAFIQASQDQSDRFTFTIPDGELLVSDSLSVNYRVSARELATLGVLVSGIIQDVADILIDNHGDPAKKK